MDQKRRRDTVPAATHPNDGQAAGSRARSRVRLRRGRNWPYRLANALHVETRTHVIRRELLLDVGDPFDSLLVAESERNLRALGIFRDVVIDPVLTDTGIVLLERTADAWTTTMGVSVATSGSESVIDLSLQESNLLGTRTVALVAYRNDPDRSAFSAASTHRAPSAIASAWARRLSSVRTDVVARGSLRLPFLSLSSKYGGSVTASAFQGRVLQFLDGVISDSLWREFAILRADGAMAITASPRGYVRVGLLAQYLRDDFVPMEDRDNVPRTRSGTAGPYIALRAPRYIRVRNFERIGRVEDFDLGPFATLTAPGCASRLGIRAQRRRCVVRRRHRSAPARRHLCPHWHSGVRRCRPPKAPTRPRSKARCRSRGNAVNATSSYCTRRAACRRIQSLAASSTWGSAPACARFPLTRSRATVSSCSRVNIATWSCPRLFGLMGVGVAAFAGHAGAWVHDTDIRTRDGIRGGAPPGVDPRGRRHLAAGCLAPLRRWFLQRPRILVRARLRVRGDIGQ